MSWVRTASGRRYLRSDGEGPWLPSTPDDPHWDRPEDQRTAVREELPDGTLLTTYMEQPGSELPPILAADPDPLEPHSIQIAPRGLRKRAEEAWDRLR